MASHDKIAVEFASALVDGDYDRAHALLAPELRAQLTPAVLQENLYAMFREYSDSEPTEVFFDEQFSMTDWPAKEPKDVGWTYVSISGDDFSEAVTVVVADLNGELLIRSVEWGRP